MGIPSWHRDGPLLYAGDDLLYVPNLGVDARVVAKDGEPQMTIVWRAHAKMAGLILGAPLPAMSTA